MKAKRHALTILALVSLIPLALLVYGYLNQDQFLVSQEAVRRIVVPFGIAAPLVFIAIQALQVVLTPISHYAVGLAGGFIFGPVVGTLLNWIGRVIGHTIAFALARYGIRPFVQDKLPAETMAKYDKYVSGSSFLLFLAFFLPIFPDDELSYLAGISKMPWRHYLTANILGQVGGSIGLAYLGAGLDAKSPVVMGLTVATLVAGIVFFAHQYRLKKKI